MKKLVLGPVYTTEGEKEIVKMPSEKKGEKVIVDKAYLQQEWDQFLEIQASPHVCEIAREGTIKRTGMDGKEFRTTENEQRKDEGMEI